MNIPIVPAMSPTTEPTQSESPTITFRFPPSLVRKIREAAKRQTAGNVNRFAKEIFEVALAPEELKSPSAPLGAKRASDYIAAKELALLFEDDVEATLKAAFPDAVERNKRFANGQLYVADFLVSTNRGQVIVECKSNSRRDRVELALGQAMIAKHRVNLPVVVVVPYFLTETFAVAGSFEPLGCRLVALPGLVEAVNEIAGT